MNDAVHHPAHYGGEENLYETIKIVKAEGWLRGFCLGSALKYIQRAGKKGKPTFNHSREDSPMQPCPECQKGQEKEVEDLRKAAWYLEYLANEIERDHD